jgi:hypothetical protein
MNGKRTAGKAFAIEKHRHARARPQRAQTGRAERQELAGTDRRLRKIEAPKRTCASISRRRSSRPLLGDGRDPNTKAISVLRAWSNAHVSLSDLDL